MVCRTCRKGKPPEEFPRHSGRRSGRHWNCKACHEQEAKDGPERRARRNRHYHLRQRYGIGADEVDEMIRQQGGLCAACKKRPATQVDHDHKSGKVRGILCLNCNAALGAFRDDPRIVWAAIEYLETANGNPITDIAGL